ncbi:MAG: hypothetical protein IKV87_01940 [Methanobrevibacter sp.]|nr:hypothetical protein [Methanobrevibacter sp.]
MIHLIGIGDDKGNTTLNDFIAIKEADIIINYDDLDLSFFKDEIRNKKVISANDLISHLKSEDDLKLDTPLEKYTLENSIIELAISKSLESKEVVLIAYDDPNIMGLANRFLQILSKYEDVKFKIHPSVSSLSKSASIAGAPLNDFAVLNLSNPIVSLSELENKAKHILEANLVLVIKNPVDDKRDYGRESLNRIKEIVNEYNDELLTAIVFADGNCSIDKFKDIDDEKIDKNSIIIVGNKLSYLLDGLMITSSDYIVEPKVISWSEEFFEKHLNGEAPRGLDMDCEYLPCHKELEACDFCYCPFYPCLDGITGGYWIKGKDVWSCQNCDWIHKEEPCLAIREGFDEMFEDIDDLKDKHIELLKLRRRSLLKTLK